MTDPKQGLEYLDQTGLMINQVTDKVLYSGLIEMQEMVESSSHTLKYMGLRQANFLARQDSDGEYYEKTEGII